MQKAAIKSDLSLFSRLWIYQKERFPLIKHGVLIVAFSSSAVCLSALLRGEREFPEFPAFAVSFAVLMTLFMQLRIADEFKDADEDARYRPERPVPRGLIRLKELAFLGAGLALMQMAVVLAYFPALSFLLVIVWVYMALMSAEFFAPAWLKNRPFLYMVSHMLIMPLIDFFATSCDWLVKTGEVPPGLVWFLIVSFFNGAVIEVGRKTWAPEMERQGVESYSSAWGIKKALLTWGSAVLAGFVCAVVVAGDIGFTHVAVPALGTMAVCMAVSAYRFYRVPDIKGARLLENVSGLWVFSIYLFLGIIPMGVKAWM